MRESWKEGGGEGEGEREGGSEGVRDESHEEGEMQKCDFIVLILLFAGMIPKPTHGSLSNQCTCAEGV